MACCSYIVAQQETHNTLTMLACSLMTQVRLYQLGNKPRTIDVLNLRETGAEAEEGAHFTEDVGMQIKLRSHVHEAEISALSYCAETKMVAVGDKSGG